MRKFASFEWGLLSSKWCSYKTYGEVSTGSCPTSLSTLNFWEITGKYLENGACKVVRDFTHVMIPTWILQELGQKWKFKIELS